MNIFHESGEAARYDNNGGTAWYKGAGEAARWNSKGGSAWHKGGGEAARWDTNGGIAWHKSGAQAARWDTNGGISWSENGSSRSGQIDIYLGDNIRLNAGPGGIMIFVHGNCVVQQNPNGSNHSNNSSSTTQHETKKSETKSYSPYCNYCGVKYSTGSILTVPTSKAGVYRECVYCNLTCAENHKRIGYLWRGPNGIPKEEREYFEAKIRKAELERIKQEEIGKIKKSEENSEFFKKYGVFLVLIISSFAGFGMLKSASADDIVAKMLMIASFFGFYIVFSFFPNVFDGQEIKDLKKKHNFKSNNIPPIVKKINLIISGLFLLTLLVLTILVKFHGSTEFLFGKSMNDLDELIIEMDSMDLIDSNDANKNLDSERKIKQPKQLEFNEVTVVNQIWMAENLNINFFQNGDLIPQAKTLEEWEEAGDSKTPAWCYYNFDSSNEKKYGKLYNWYAVGDSRGLAPKGWRIPSDEDWDLLTDNLGYPDEYADKIKAKKGWNLNNGTNSSGFSALPGGYIEDSGFEGIGTDAFWWSSTLDSYTLNAVWVYSLNYQDDRLGRFKGSKSEGFSIRCIKK